MSKEIYKELLDVMKKRGGNYAGADIPVRQIKHLGCK